MSKKVRVIYDETPLGTGWLVKKAADELGIYDEGADLALSVDPKRGGDVHWEIDSTRKRDSAWKNAQDVYFAGNRCDKVYIPNGVFLPQATDPDIYKRDESVEQDYDVVFVGNTSPAFPGYEERKRLLEDVLPREGVSVHAVETTKEDYVKEMSRGKLIFNYPGLTDLNRRNFEAMAIGCMISLYNGHDDIMTPYEHYIPFRDEQELIRNIRTYLDLPEERQRIADNARRHVINHHTYKHRLMTMLDFFSSSRDWQPNVYEYIKGKKLVEFGLGEGTDFLLQHCSQVKSVELAENEGWLVQVANKHGNNNRWCSKFYEYGTHQEFSPWLEKKVREEARGYDVAFVDSGCWCRGQIVNALLGYVDTVFAHDTNDERMGWRHISVPEDYEVLTYPSGCGTTVWKRSNYG